LGTSHPLLSADDVGSDNMERRRCAMVDTSLDSGRANWVTVVRSQSCRLLPPRKSGYVLSCTMYIVYIDLSSVAQDGVPHSGAPAQGSWKDALLSFR
jgi:hypothetical protein